jgi:molybdate transport system ATP-binding protein
VALTGEGLTTALPLAVLSLAVTGLTLVALQWVARVPRWRRAAPAASPLRGRAFSGQAPLSGEAAAPEKDGWGPPPGSGATGGRLAVEVDLRLGQFHLEATLAAEPGILVLFGPSGSGKTTLLNCIAGSLTPDEGLVSLDGRVLLDVGASREPRIVPPHLRHIAVVFQDYSLFPHLRVMGNVLFGTQGAEADVVRAREVLAMCRLNGLEDRYPHQLSGGQQQRVALARALVTQPRVLLLDEPFSALDSNVREKLQMDLLRLQQRLGLTILHVTHDLREALVLADRMAVLNEGRIEQIGTKDEVLRHPVNEAAARFVGTRNMLQGRVVSQEPRGLLIETAALRLWTPVQSLPLGSHVQVFVRPEEITPLWDGASADGRDNVVVARALAEQDRGLVWRVFLRPRTDDGKEEELVMDVPAHDYDYYRAPQTAASAPSLWTVLVPQTCLHVISAEEGCREDGDHGSGRVR